MSTEQPQDDSTDRVRSERKAPTDVQAPPQQRYFELSSTGDVVFVLQDNSRWRVQAAVLRNASPTFQAMLGPHFSDGQDLSCQHPKDLPLPDDDPMAMKILCGALHHRHDMSKAVPVADLTTLAVTIDKYLCTSAMKPFSTMWLNSALAKVDELRFPELVDLLAAAYLFKLPELFYKISSKVVFRHHSGDPFEFDHSMEYLPWKCIVSIVAYKNKYEHDLAEAIQAVLFETLDKCKVTVDCTMGWGCQELKTTKLWDSSLVPSFGASLETYFQMMNGRPNHWGETYKERLEEVLVPTTRVGNQSVCSKCRSFMLAELPRAMQETLDAFRSSMKGKSGLCLHCVKEGRRSMYQCPYGVHKERLSSKRQRTS